MVKEIEFIDEYYDDDDDDELAFIPPNYFKSDEQLVLIALLMLLEQRYRLLKSMTPEDILDEIDEIMDSLESELLSTAEIKVDNAVWDAHLKELNEYSIPVMGYIEQDTSMYSLIRKSITALINRLKDELTVKAEFFKDNMSNTDFNITPNFRRAINKLNDAVGNNLIYSKEKSHRKVLEFVYGEDKLYLWSTAKDNRVCEWCREQEAMPPRRLEDLPLDHPRGRCVLVPVDYEYSPAYYSLLAQAEFRPLVEAYERGVL